MRRRLDSELTASGGRAPTEWPSPARTERLATLRRLARMHQARLRARGEIEDVQGVVYAATGILELAIGDRDALESLEQVFESTGDVPRLRDIPCPQANRERHHATQQKHGKPHQHQHTEQGAQQDPDFVLGKPG